MKNGEGQNLSRFGFKVTRIFWWTGLIEVPRRHGHCGALIVPRAHVPAISAWSLQLYGQFVPIPVIQLFTKLPVSQLRVLRTGVLRTGHWRPTYRPL